jgi:hypothetical protein
MDRAGKKDFASASETVQSSSGMRLDSIELRKDGMARELLGITVAFLRPVKGRSRLPAMLLPRSR